MKFSQDLHDKSYMFNRNLKHMQQNENQSYVAHCSPFECHHTHYTSFTYSFMSVKHFEARNFQVLKK